jgi:hypothetical protein
MVSRAKPTSLIFLFMCKHPDQNRLLLKALPRRYGRFLDRSQAVSFCERLASDTVPEIISIPRVVARAHMIP